MASLVNRRSLVWALVLVPLLSYLGGRIRILSLGYYNARGRMPLHSNFSSYEIKFQDKIRNCEDVLLLKNRPVALLACDPGRDNWNTVMGDFPEDAEIDPNAGLYAYNYQQPGDKALFRFKILGYDDELRTIGVEFHEPSSTLLATNHLRQGGPRIEQFRLDFNAMTATHIRTISHPLINTPNAIAASSADEFFVTNQHLFVPAKNRLLWLLETYLAPPLGRVVHVRILPSGEIDAAVSVRQAYPNGITFFGEDESRVAVASSNKALVYIYKVLKGGKITHPLLELENTIRNLPYMPDNVGTSTDGALIIAGHPNLRKLGQFASSRKFCHRPETLAKATQATKELCRNLQGASWVSEWSEKDGLSHIYSGWEYPTSATAVHDRARGVGIIAGLYAQGIFVWRD